VIKHINFTLFLGSVPRISGKDDDWSRRARRLVAIPPSLVKALDCFNDDPEELYSWREAMADMIETEIR
jgi:hypothetical protein